MGKHVIRVDENTLQCCYCTDPIRTWTRIDGIKFQSGNITSHMNNVHRNIMSEETQTSYKKSDLNNDIFEWIVSTGRPISLIEDRQFVRIIEKLGGQLFKRTQLMKNCLPALLHKTILKLQNELAGIDQFSITSDGYSTSLNKQIHWSCTTIHWIGNKGDLQTRLIDIGDLGLSATADRIKQI